MSAVLPQPDPTVRPAERPKVPATVARSRAVVTIRAADIIETSVLAPSLPQHPLVGFGCGMIDLGLSIAAASPGELEDAGHRLIALADEARRLIDEQDGTT